MSVSSHEDDPNCISEISHIDEERNVGLIEAVNSFSEVYEHDVELLLEACESSPAESSQYYILDCCACYHLVINNLHEGINPSKRRINKLCSTRYATR